MIQLREILDKVREYHPAADLEVVKRAHGYAAKMHAGQVRKSGEPFLAHPLGVATIIADLKLDVPSVCAGLLHDCVEDTTATLDEVTKMFGAEIAFLVDGVTKLSRIPWNTKEERQAENFRKMLIAMARDIRVILIKLADRVHNMRTLGHMSGDKQERIARETLDIYAPLANRLGIQWIKTELEDLSFRYLYPAEFKALAERVEKAEPERKRYVQEVIKILEKKMIEHGFRSAEITGRPKNFYSIWQKMRRDGRDYEQIFDVVAFRLAVDSVRECYEVLGVIHSLWTPIPGRFKDYIALPKPNLYQSLHTSVIGPRGERMEVQLRTREMHRVAEEGIAAHWRYKEGRPVEPKDEKKFAWLRQMMEWQQEVKDPNEFIETVKVDLFADEVYVFTPKGDVKAFPRGATPVDFAFAVHSEVGSHCSGAKVNGAIVPLKYQLNNGDTIEIITSAQQRPSKDWLKFVGTSRAKAKIRHYVVGEQRERSLGLGKELLERELRKYGASLARLTKDGELERAAPKLKLTTADEVVVALGYGKLTAAQVVEAVLPPEQRNAPAKPEPQGKISQLLAKITKRAPQGIKIQGLDDVMVRFAKCCNPVPGDSVIGFITRGRGITVHTRICPKTLDLDPDRRIEVTWDQKAKAARPVAIQVICADKPGLLANISQSFTENGVNISQANCKTTEDHRAVNTFQVSVTNLDQLKAVMRAIQRITGVYSVQRV